MLEGAPFQINGTRFYLVPTQNGLEIHRQSGKRLEFVWHFHTLDAMMERLPALVLAEKTQKHKGGKADLAALKTEYTHMLQGLQQFYEALRKPLADYNATIKPSKVS